MTILARLILHLQSKAIQRQAMRDLAADKKRRMGSFEVADFRKRRAAALKVTRA